MSSLLAGVDYVLPLLHLMFCKLFAPLVRLTHKYRQDLLLVEIVSEVWMALESDSEHLWMLFGLRLDLRVEHGDPGRYHLLDLHCQPHICPADGSHLILVVEVISQKLHEDESILFGVFLTLVYVDEGHQGLVPVLVRPLLHPEVELTLLVYDIKEAQALGGLEIDQNLAS